MQVGVKLQSINPTLFFGALLAFVFFIWLIYTAVVVYHWVRYGHQTKAGVPALLTHFIVSAVLFLIAGSAFI